MTTYPRIPYGEADFRRIRLNHWLYVDKTHFLPELENERYVFFIRPRRFGKSCWVAALEAYYSRYWAHEFEAVFSGTDIGRQPTDDQGRYVVLRFNFSAFNDALETLDERFEEYCDIKLRGVLRRNADLFSEKAVRRILAPASIGGKLGELFEHAAEHGIPLYVLIDEYDNFANTILAHRGAEAYRSLTYGGGFYRNFFATLKAGAGEAGGLERLFITGVSPITLDDVTSGFNIGTNVSLNPKFNEMLGFTEAEVRDLLGTYQDLGVFSQDVDEALGLMREWYNGYRFSEDTEIDLYNTDSVLYYLKQSIPNERGPRELIDVNVRIDYGKLRHLLTVNQEMSAKERGAHLSAGATSPSPAATQAAGRSSLAAERRELNGNFDLLRRIIGEGAAEAELSLGFPLERLEQPENFLSLMHYFGLLSIRGLANGAVRLGIPNQTVRRLMYGYLRDAYRDVGIFSVSHHHFSRLVRDMAYRGDWRPALEFIRDAIAEQTGIRDYIDGEKVVHAFLAAHLSMTNQFVIHSEHELNKGYADLYLEPFTALYPSVSYGYVIELKYLKRGEALNEHRMQEKMGKAKLQLQSYLQDKKLRRLRPAVHHIGLAVIFHGWQMVAYEAVGGPDGKTKRRHSDAGK